MSRRAATTKQAGRFRHTRQGGLPFGPPRRRGFSAYRHRQVCPRRRFLLGAKKSKPSQPGGDSERLPTTVAEPNGVVTTYTYNSVNDITGETVTPYYTYALHSNRVSETTIRSKERPTKANNGGQK